MTDQVPGPDSAAPQAADAHPQLRHEDTPSSSSDVLYPVVSGSIFASSISSAAEQVRAILQQEEVGDRKCPLLFIQLNALFSTPAGLEWKETAR